MKKDVLGRIENTVKDIVLGKNNLGICYVYSKNNLGNCYVFGKNNSGDCYVFNVKYA